MIFCQAWYCPAKRTWCALTSAVEEGEWSSLRPGRFSLRKEPRYLLDRRLSGAQSRSERCGEEKNKNKCLYTLLTAVTSLVSHGFRRNILGSPLQHMSFFVDRPEEIRIYCIWKVTALIAAGWTTRKRLPARAKFSSPPAGIWLAAGRGGSRDVSYSRTKEARLIMYLRVRWCSTNVLLSLEQFASLLSVTENSCTTVSTLWTTFSIDNVLLGFGTV
jgi:hypothetical protein